MILIDVLRNFGLNQCKKICIKSVKDMNFTALVKFKTNSAELCLFTPYEDINISRVDRCCLRTSIRFMQVNYVQSIQSDRY